MNDNIEQRARELLAAEIRASGRRLSAMKFSEGLDMAVDSDEALCAIAAALRSVEATDETRPVVWIRSDEMIKANDGAFMCHLRGEKPEGSGWIALYLRPQPAGADHVADAGKMVDEDRIAELRASRDAYRHDAEALMKIVKTLRDDLEQQPAAPISVTDEDVAAAIRAQTMCAIAESADAKMLMRAALESFATRKAGA